MTRSSELELPPEHRYEIRRRLGAGGMGVVYEAYDREMQTRLALKTLRRLDAQSLYRLKREFRAAHDVEHPNLVRLGELCEERGRWYFTMELVEGVDFLSYVWGRDRPEREQESSVADADPLAQPSSPGANGAPSPSLDEARLRACAGQLASALFALHTAGRVHRDVKPSNAMVTGDGRVVLLDFGLAAPTSSDQSSSAGHGAGTVAYMAPEQALGPEAAPAADWYSFGVVLYQALTGRLPYVGSSAVELVMKKQQYIPPPPRARVPDVPRDLDLLCEDLLRIDPKDRPPGTTVLERLAVDVDRVTHSLAAASATESQLTQTAPFVGRERELRVLRAAFERMVDGEPLVVSVHGESGLGKTALIRELTQALAAERNDLLVLLGRCYERESVPFKAFDGIVDALAHHMRKLSEIDAAQLLPANAALLRRVFPVLGRVEAIARAPRLARVVKDPHELRSRVFSVLKGLLAALAERKPLVVVIDDLQWADPDSLLLLGEILQPPDAPALLLLMSSRSEPDDAALAVPSLPASVSHQRIVLQPLEPEEGALLAQLLLERRGVTGNTDPASLAAEAQGHPLYIDELVRHVELSESAVGQRPRLDEAIWKRATSLPAPARELLELICLAGEPLPERTIREAAGAGAQSFERHITLLRVASLARTGGGSREKLVEPYHDRVRQAVLEHLVPVSRRARHERLAIALEAAGLAEQRPQLLVRHLEGAGQIRKAAELAEESARRATRALAFDRAAELYRTALRLGNYRGNQLRTLRISLADALANAGKCSEAALVFAKAAIDADPGTRLECQRRAAQQFLISGHIEDGLDTLRAVLGDIGVSIAPTPRRALASLLWQRLKLRVRGLGWKERHESQIAPEALKRLDVFGVVFAGLGAVDTIRAMSFQSRALLLALETGERHRVSLALCHEAAFVASQGHRSLDRARSLLDAARSAAEGTSDPYLEAWHTFTEGFLGYFAGWFRSAADHFEAAEWQLREETVGSVWVVNNARLFRLHSIRLQGTLARLRELHDDYVRDAVQRGDRYLETTLRRSNAVLCLAADDPRRTLDELARATWAPPEETFHLQHWYELEARAQMAIYEGRAATALDELAADFERLESSMLLRIQTVRTQAHWLRARLLLAAAVDRSRSRNLAKASALARKLGREGVGYATAWSLLLCAALAAQGGTRDPAVELLQNAAETASANDMVLAAAIARRRMGQLMGGAQGGALVGQADAWMTEEGVVDCARFVEVLAPGFASDSPAPR